jgi:FMN phosphatase YigB (HAD superfamily)
MGRYYEIFPDVLPTLEFLKANGFHTGVVSNTDERLSKFSLLSIYPSFLLIFSYS